MYRASERRVLLELARHAIEFGLRAGEMPEVPPDRYASVLRQKRSSFVTLKCDRRLRGCIGQLEAQEPLVQSVVRNAYAAAFSDPRFPPLCAVELPGVTISLSVLSEQEPLSFDSEQQLLQQLTPGRDGLVLQDRGKRGTFLPAVWENLPDPRDFLRELKNKAGLEPDHWSATLTVTRYATDTFAESDDD